MNIHKNARLTPLARERLALQIESGRTPEATARAAGVCPRAARKWWKRYKAEGVAGLQDRSSRPHRLNRLTPEADRRASRGVATPALDRRTDRR